MGHALEGSATVLQGLRGGTANRVSVYKLRDACTCMHDASSPGFAEHMSPMQLWGEYCAVHMTCDVGHLLPIRAETMWQWVLSERGELFPWGVCLPRWIWGRFLRSYPM